MLKLNKEFGLILMDGYEAITVIKKETSWYKTVLIIALTASALKGNEEKCIASGMNDYLIKPINILEATIAKFLSLRE